MQVFTFYGIKIEPQKAAQAALDVAMAGYYDAVDSTSSSTMPMDQKPTQHVNNGALLLAVCRGKVWIVSL